MKKSKYFVLFIVIMLMVTFVGNSSTQASTSSALDSSYVSPEIIISDDDRSDYSPAIAFNSKHSEYLVVWESVGAGGYHDVYAQRISATGDLLSWFAVGTLLNNKAVPSVAYDPVNDRYLVVWAYDFNGYGTDWDVYGRFIPWNGPDPGIAEFPICGWTSNQGHPNVVYARVFEEFMVVWTSSADQVPGYISGRIVFANGNMGDDFTISSGGQIRDFPDVAYNFTRNEFLVVWDLELSASNLDIYGRRFQGNGTPIGDEFIIASWPDFESNPSVAACYQADQYMVGWQSDQGTHGADYAIYARYISGDAIPGNIVLIDDTTSPELNVDIACNRTGLQYMLVWQTRYAQPILYGIWARRANPDGSLVAQFPVHEPFPENCEYPAISAGDSSFLVAWEWNENQNRDIHGALLRHAVYIPIIVR